MTHEQGLEDLRQWVPGRRTGAGGARRVRARGRPRPRAGARAGGDEGGEGGDIPFPPSGKQTSFAGNGWQVRELFKADGKVLVCFAGHKHRNRWTVRGGTNYITLAATHWGGSYAKVTVSDKLQIEGYGNQRNYEITFPDTW